MAIAWSLSTFSSDAAAQCVQNKTLAPDAAPDSVFGISLASDDDVLVVGAMQADVGVDPNGDEGAVYVFRHVDGDWVPEAQVFATDAQEISAYGRDVAVEGNTLVVGAYAHKVGGISMGAVYVYTFDGTAWGDEVQLLAHDPFQGGQFGYSVDLSGDTLAISAHHYGPGRVEVFRLSGGLWAYEATLLDSSGIVNDFFGRSVAVDGDTLIVGSTGDDEGGDSTGSAYVYHRTGGLWSLQAKLLAPDPFPGASVGFDVALQGDVALVGAPGDGVGGVPAGAVYSFRRTDGVWAFEQRLVSGDPSAADVFGHALSLDGDVLIVGEPQDDATPVLTNSGCAWRFEWNGAQWVDATRLAPGDPTKSAQFGQAVTISGERSVVGAWQDNDLGTSTGSIYTFEGDPAFIDLGYAMLGSNGLPCLGIEASLDPGSTVELRLLQARPSSVALLFASINPLFVAFKAGFLVPYPDMVLPVLTDPSGALVLGKTWPAGVPPGITLYLQYWIPDPVGLLGFSASNALAGTTP